VAAVLAGRFVPSPSVQTRGAQPADNAAQR
jgi:hypothetical protein